MSLFIFLFFNTWSLFVHTLWVLGPLFGIGGILGGFSYVNVMHQILEKDDLRQDEKEAAIVVSLMFNDTAILLASLFGIVLDNTIFSSGTF